ncbi:hypothetical protein ACQUJS_04010 [Ralstonia pseudosolanacearum]
MSEFLPARADVMTRYFVGHVESLLANTLHARLLALAQWRQTQGFPDPTKAPHARKVIKGIATRHPVKEKRAS